MPSFVKVCVLGSTGVGKTKLIRQFVENQYEDQYQASPPNGNAYNCSTLLNGNLYHLKIIDMPLIKEFPADALAEWSEFQQCVLRSAHAYIFVFDLTSSSTFYYIKVIRDQLFEHRNMQNVPVWIVGNKADLCLNVMATMRSHRHDHHHHHHYHHHHHHNQRPLIHSSQHPVNSFYDDLVPAFKELSNLVRKHWKCSYIECSAKYNWRIVPIFREILKSIDSSMLTTDHHLSSQPHSSFKENPTRSMSIRTIATTGNDTALLTNRNKQHASSEDTTSNGTVNRSNKACNIL